MDINILIGTIYRSDNPLTHCVLIVSVAHDNIDAFI